MSTKFLLSVMLPLALAGCSSLSGLGGDARPTCKAPEGVPCRSVSGVYVNSSPDASAASAVPSTLIAATPRPAHPTRAMGSDEPPPTLGAIRSEPTVLRIWVAPFEDSDGDLVDQSWVYLQVDNGRWLVEHSRERIRQAFAPRMPEGAAPSPVLTPAPPSKSPAAAPSPAARPAGIPAIAPPTPKARRPAGAQP